MNKKMTTNPPYDPLEDLPDPVIFYDDYGNPTGQTMTKAEIREKRLGLLYCGIDKPADVITEEERRKMEETWDFELMCPKVVSPFHRLLQERHEQQLKKSGRKKQ